MKNSGTGYLSRTNSIAAANRTPMQFILLYKIRAFLFFYVMFTTIVRRQTSKSAPSIRLNFLRKCRSSKGSVGTSSNDATGILVVCSEMTCTANRGGEVRMVCVVRVPTCHLRRKECTKYVSETSVNGDPHVSLG